MLLLPIDYNRKTMKILVLEQVRERQEQIQAHLSRYQVEIFFAQSVEEARCLIQQREGWVNIIISRISDDVEVLIEFVKDLVSGGFEKRRLCVFSEEREYRMRLVVAGCYKEAEDGNDLVDQAAKCLGLQPPFRPRRRRTTLTNAA